MLGWLLNAVYLGLIIAVSPVLGWRALRQGKYRQGWSQKLLGRLPRFDGERGDRKRVIWLHAVSVGEVLQLKTVVPRLRELHPDCQLLITTTTSTGRSVIAKEFPDCRAAYFPLDFTWAVRSALARVRPKLIVLVELELWPNLIREAAAAGVPLVLINGRMSDRSYRGYRRIRPLMRPLLGKFTRIAVQTNEYAARLLDLGAPRDRVTVTGSIKFDGVRTHRQNADTEQLRRAFGIGAHERVLIAGSTHEPEERVALDAYRRLRAEFDDLRLILVPRHAERFDEVATMVTAQGLPLLRRSARLTDEESCLRDRACYESASGSSGHEPPVCLLDTLGELSACWGLADVAFVGGSLTARGGQNMIEPAAYGAAVIVGPNTRNFRDIVEGLTSCDGIAIIREPDELASAAGALLRDPLSARKQGTAAQTFVLGHQGATERTVQLMSELLTRPARAKAA